MAKRSTQPELPLGLPVAKVHRIEDNGDDFDVLVCPHCRAVQDMDECDVIGADKDGGVFCVECHEEFRYG